MKRLVLAAGMVASVAACSTGPAAPPPDPPQIEPGVYLLLRGNEKHLTDINRMTGAMLVAGEFCGRTNQKPEIILGGEGDQKFMAFTCGEEGVWPPQD
jgi:hypothetical protein